jgi:hypothetical protein
MRSSPAILRRERGPQSDDRSPLSRLAGLAREDPRDDQSSKPLADAPLDALDGRLVIGADAEDVGGDGRLEHLMEHDCTERSRIAVAK